MFAMCPENYSNRSAKDVKKSLPMFGTEFEEEYFILCENQNVASCASFQQPDRQQHRHGAGKPVLYLG